ncbi:Ribose import ATP-binding protein RbsA [compost metagenome]
MRDKCDEGPSILFYSSDAAELVGLSDRVLVLHDGHVATELRGDDITEERIVGAMVGADPGRTAVVA